MWYKVLNIVFLTVMALATVAAVWNEIGPDRVWKGLQRIFPLAIGFFYVAVGLYLIGAFAVGGPLPFQTVEVDSQGQMVVKELELPLNVRTQRIANLSVSPHGWQPTGVWVETGQEVSITAEGTIHIALAELVENVNKRRAIEDRRDNKGLVIHDFDDTELNTILDESMAWMGPDGRRFRSIREKGREETRPVPNAKFGALVGMISTSAKSTEVPKGKPFAIGNKHAFQVENSGQLWLTINDVGYFAKKPANYYQIWHRDNIGSYRVVVHITE